MLLSKNGMSKRHCLIHSGDVIGLFVGHDHANDYMNEYEGLYIGYGRKTGYGCYGPPEG